MYRFVYIMMGILSYLLPSNNDNILKYEQDKETESSSVTWNRVEHVFILS